MSRARVATKSASSTTITGTHCPCVRHPCSHHHHLAHLGGVPCQALPLVVGLAEAIVQPEPHITDRDELLLNCARNARLSQPQILLRVRGNTGHRNQ